MSTTPATNARTIRDLRTVGRNRVLVVLATGPSVREVEDLVALKGAESVDTLAINRPVPELEPTDILLFQDAATYVRLRDYLATYPGLILSGVRAMSGDVPNGVYSPLRQGQGWSRDLEGGWYAGKSSTYAACLLAAWMNYQSVFVLGCVMGEVGGSLWRYGRTRTLAVTIAQGASPSKPATSTTPHGFSCSRSEAASDSRPTTTASRSWTHSRGRTTGRLYGRLWGPPTRRSAALPSGL